MSLKTEKIWMDGEMVRWEDAKVHVLAHALHYGTAYFEGIRANHLKECYIRPLAFVGLGEMGLYAPKNPVNVCIAVWPWGAYLGDEGLQNGIRAKVSSYTRHHVNVMMTKSKASGNYINSVLAKTEVKNAGYDEAIMLDAEGYVSEASGENIFIVRDKGYELVEERFTRDELYTADEAFFTGTAAELTPIREVDDRQIGPGRRGPVTADLQQTFFDVIKGKNERYATWLAYL